MPDPPITAILQTLIYADLFDYPLTPDQVFRFLIGVRASREQVERALNDSLELNSRIARVDGFLTLSQREALVSTRANWRTVAQRQMRRAHFYGRLMSYFPFVRMIALTGSLAMENARDNDMDFLIVTTQGRLWLVRGFIVVLVRLARLIGDRLCPNFLLTENALTISDQDLYHAHEIVQMIPLYGHTIYQRLRHLNAWTDAYLPNADGSDFKGAEIPLSRIGALLKRLGQYALCGKIGDYIERWEMTRKVAKLTAQISPDSDEAEFSADVCRGFLTGHSRRVLWEYHERVTNYQFPITPESV